MLGNLKSIFCSSKRFKHGRNVTPCEFIINLISKTFSLMFPIFKLLFFSPSNHYVYTRQMLSFVIGSLYSILIFYFTIGQIENLSDFLNMFSFACILVVIPFVMSFNQSSRCLMTLSTFNFIASSAKVLLTSYIIVNLLDGPIDNTLNNLIGLTRTFKCQIEMSRNFSKEIKNYDQLEQNSMMNALIESQDEVSELNTDISDMIEATDQATSEDFDDSIKYLGCYHDQITEFAVNRGRDVSGAFYDSYSNMTIVDCYQFCLNKDFRYAALQNGNECRCSNSYGKYGQSKSCVVVCSGNQHQLCGGYSSNSVFDVKPMKETANGVYVGCLKLQKTYEKLPIGRLEDCFLACFKRNYSFAAAYKGEFCFCQNEEDQFESYRFNEKYILTSAEVDFDSVNFEDEDLCTFKCIGNKEQICGGKNSFASVYLIDSSRPFYQIHFYTEKELNNNQKYENSNGTNQTSGSQLFVQQLSSPSNLKQQYVQRCLDQLKQLRDEETKQPNRFISHCTELVPWYDYLFGICKGMTEAAVMPTDPKGAYAVRWNHHTEKRRSDNPKAACNQQAQSLDLDHLKEHQNDLRNLKAEFDPQGLEFSVTRTNLKLALKSVTTSLDAAIVKIIADIQAMFKRIKSSVYFIKILTSFSFMFVFINSYRYFFSYVKRNDYDNFCITQYFRHIDARRCNEKKRTLLPLKKSEKLKLHYPLDIFVSAYQKPLIKFNIFMHSSLIVILLVALLADYTLTDFLLILRNNTLINYKMVASSENELDVCGEGVVARLMRKAHDDSVNRKQTHERYFNNSQCLLKVGQLRSEQTNTLLIQFVLLNFCILFELYVKRLNKLICSLFYRKLEKKRIIWLYNDLLKKRKSFIENCKIKVNYKKKTNRLNTDRIQHSKGFLRWIETFKKKFLYEDKYCALCESSKRETSVECSKCLIFYCIECWIDLEEKCIGCLPDYFLYEENYDQDSEDTREENVENKDLIDKIGNLRD